MNGAIRVVLVEDHEMVAQGLITLLAAEPDIEPVDVASTIADATDAVSRHVPDVVLMDYRLPDGDGTDAARRVLAEHPSASIVMLTGQTDQGVLAAALDAGVCGFVSKQAPATELVAAVRAAAAGDSYFSPDVLTTLVRLHRQTDGAAPAGSLNPREREVLQLVADGMTVAAVAAELHLSVHTVRNHVRHAMQKLGVHTKLDAVLAAARAGVVRLEPDRGAR